MVQKTEAYKSLTESLRGIRVIMSHVPDHSCETNFHHLKVQSYVLLSHAAFEQYLEDLARYASLEAMRALKNEGAITKTLLALVTSEAVSQVDFEVSRKKITREVAGSLESFAVAARNNFEKDIKSNHGVKADNQKNLLVRIGFDPEQIDLPTFAALDAFGTKRGQIAHKVKMTTTDTRSSIIAEVRAIYSGLLHFDRAAVQALKLRMT